VVPNHTPPGPRPQLDRHDIDPNGQLRGLALHNFANNLRDLPKLPLLRPADLRLGPTITVATGPCLDLHDNQRITIG